MSTGPDTLMTLLPAGTIIQAPDGINRVTFMFKSADDAIVFFEYFIEITKAEAHK
jgi:hypothetical protein